MTGSPPLSSLFLLGLLPACAAAPQDAPSPEAQGEAPPPESAWRRSPVLPLESPDSFIERPGDLELAPPAEDAEAGEFLFAPVPFFSEQLGWGLALGAGYIFQVDPESGPSTVGLGGIVAKRSVYYGEHALPQDTWAWHGCGR